MKTGGKRKIFGKCYADIAPLKTFALRAEIKHLQGKGNVQRILGIGRTPKNIGSVCVVDKDARNVADRKLYEYFNLKEIFMISNSPGLKKHLGPNDNVLIEIVPALEGWLIADAKEADLDLNSKRYKLSDDPKVQHSLLANPTNKYLNFIRDLTKKPETQLCKLKDILTEPTK